MDDYFKFFYEEEGFGPAVDSRSVSDERIASYRGRLPDLLLSYWKLYGLSGYGKGLVWLVDPADYAPVLSAWIEGTSVAEKDVYHVVARSAFGELFLWGEKTGLAVRINTAFSMIFPGDDSQKVLADQSDALVQSFFVGMDKTGLDFEDESRRPLFERAVAKLGVLRADQMYGFVPALALGGSSQLDHLQIVDAVPHLVMLAQLGERKVMRDIVADAKASGLL